jgi:hypothetical protein
VSKNEEREFFDEEPRSGGEVLCGMTRGDEAADQSQS